MCSLVICYLKQKLWRDSIVFVSNWSKVAEAEFSGALRVTVPMEAGTTVLLNLYELMRCYRLLSSVKNEMTLNTNLIIIFGFDGYVIQSLSYKQY